MPRHIIDDDEDDEQDLTGFELLQSVEPEENGDSRQEREIASPTSATNDTVNTINTIAVVDTSCTFVGMPPGPPSDHTGLLDVHEGVARCFLADELEGRICFVREFCKNHGYPRDLISSNRPCLVRAAEAPGLMQQWFVIDSLVMRNVDRYPSGVLEKWIGDVETHLEYNGCFNMSATTLNLHYLTRTEILTFQLFLPILLNYRRTIEQALVQCHLALQGEDTLRSPAHIISHSMGV